MNRYACHILNHVFADHSRMIRGSAGYQVYLLHLAQFTHGQVQATQTCGGELFIDAGAEAVGDGGWLLEYLLEHKVLIITLVDSCDIPIHCGNEGIDMRLIHGGDIHPVLGNDCHFMVLQIDDAAGMAHDGVLHRW